MVCFSIAVWLLMLNLPVLDLPGIIVLVAGMILSVVSGIAYLRKYLAKVL
jgi:hypothetical protein